MEEIMQAVATLQAGNLQAAREQLLKLWDMWAVTGAPLECSTIAHFIADTQEHPSAELEWDLRALQAATGVREPEDHEPDVPSLQAFLPSLHLNVGDAYRRVGEPTRARRHAEIGLRHVRAVEDNGYGGMIKAGLDRLLSRLDGDL